MLNRYARYSKKHNTFHLILVFGLMFICFIHLAILLETGELCLLPAMIIYIPVYIVWLKVSNLRSKLPG